MKPDDAPRVRLRIDRLSLDLHGITAATAEDVARALGPALGAALLESFACASWPGESSAIRARLMVACRVAEVIFAPNRSVT